MLARRGPLAILSLAVSALSVLVLVPIAITLARRGSDAPVHGVPELASSALAWGGGFLHAVAVAAGALRRDRTEGVRHLFVTRTTSLRGYVVGRVGGLAAVLAAVAVGGTLIVSVAALLATPQVQGLARTLQATIGAVLYALAFAAVVAPVAFAALGARSRLSGYLVLILVLVLPELLFARLPHEVSELCSIPSALAALRASIGIGRLEPFRFLRALVALGVYVAVALLFVRRDVARTAYEDG